MNKQSSNPSSSPRRNATTGSTPRRNTSGGNRRTRSAGSATRVVRSSSIPARTSTSTSSPAKKTGSSGRRPQNNKRRPSTRTGSEHKKPHKTSGRKPSGGNKKRRKSSAPKRGSSQTHRTIQKLKSQYVYTRGEMNERQEEIMRAVPALADGDLRVVPVCGCEWVTTNMTFVEYKDEIVIIDAGFGFPSEDMPGVNYTIPDITYLKENRHKIKGIVITHGHLDHVGAIPYVIEDLGFPPIYSREFGAMFIKKKVEEFPQIAEKVDIQIVEGNMGYLPVGDSKIFKAKFFGLTHSIPDSSGVIVQTPLGGIVSTGDVRVENTNGVPAPDEVEGYSFFKDENILMLTMDSTNIERSGWSASEEAVKTNIDRIIKEAPARLFISVFSSQVERIMSFMESAAKHGKYVAFEGRSIKSNMGIAEMLELTDFKHVIPISEIDDYPQHKVVVILTGAQGEQFAALNRAARGDHKTIKFRDTDTIVLSASIVPGNQFAVAQMKNQLYKGSYNVIAHSDNKVHASGHGNREELKWVNNQIPYKYMMPIHGEPYMIRMHAKMVIEEIGVPKQNVVIPENGTIVEIRKNGEEMVVLDQKIPADVIVVDGSYYGPLHKVVTDDRIALSEDGMFVVVVSIDIKNGKLKKSPDIISRGFVYLRESKDLLNKVRGLVKRSVEQYIKGKRHVEFEDVKKLVTEKVSKYLIQHTHKEPIVIPVVLGV